MYDMKVLAHGIECEIENMCNSMNSMELYPWNHVFGISTHQQIAPTFFFKTKKEKYGLGPLRIFFFQFHHVAKLDH